jgi:hypothetical protein
MDVQAYQWPSDLVARCFVAVGSRGLFVFVEDVGELSRIEDLAAELAHNKLGVLLAGDDADLGMFARCRHKGKKLRVDKKFAFAQTACQS